MTLADDIAGYLQDAFVQRHRPFCICVDPQLKLTDWWGDGGEFGFVDLQRGQDMLAQAPFLHGQLADELTILPHVSTPRTGPVEVHIMPRGDDYLVVLLSKDAEHAATQVRQQSVNEVRLLHAHQQKLIGRQRELIAELIETRAELDHRRQEAERANVAKSRFIAMMSHEFRTPLAAIASYADRILEADSHADAALDCGRAISRASRHMLDMINSVLDDARLEAGRTTLNVRVLVIRSLIDDLTAIIAPLAGEKALSFAAQLTSRVPECVTVDDGRLRQILLNLLGNAVKFTDDGQVSLVIDWQDGQLIATVADNGPGIAAADQERLFRAFERGVQDDSTIEGSGLGLSISARLANIMDGRLAMDSDVGRGCTVTLTVPAAATERPSEEHSALAPPDTRLQARRPAVILICDDDPDMRAIHEYYLTRAGYELLLASDSRTAVELALSEQPDLVLLDINTPGMSGIEAAQLLRRKGCTAPVVALTASDASKLDPDLFNERLRKPLRMPELLDVLNKHLQAAERSTE